MDIQVLFSILVIPLGILQIKAVEIIQSCPSVVYCQGDLLDTVQRLRINTDSKTFVDMEQRNAQSVTLQNFQNMMTATNKQPGKDVVKKFVEENFIAGDELEEWTPHDHTESPAILKKIEDRDIRNFTKSLVKIWPSLGRRVKERVKQNPERHSLIPLPQGFIIPGGRFREIYYWDSYWIVKGLLISEMKDTVKGILENFVYLVKNYGLIPNGSRIYYLNRSQPPLFASMVEIYIEYTNDLAWLRGNIYYIEKELLWWINNRVVSITKDGVEYKMAHYGVESNTPRPESYAEDVTTCAYFTTEDEQRKCYSALKTGAESGWDFSTRWIFDAQGSTNANLTKIDTKRVIPVDLNALLCKSFKVLSDFYGQIGDTKSKNTWANYYDQWLKNMKTLNYNENDGIWYDFDRDLLQQRKIFFPSNFVPLWAECYNTNEKSTHGEKAANYLSNQLKHNYLGGIPTSLENSGEQWDLPNAWPPLQEYVVLGLHKTGNKQAQMLAEEYGNRWITANMKGFEKTGAMFEKYDAVEPGKYGGGGEYAVQVGFGWSNGVALSLIKEFNSARVSKAILNVFNYIVVFSMFTFVGNLLYL